MAADPSLPHKVFRQNYGRLQCSITGPVGLAGKLFAKELIGTETNNKVVTTDAATIDKATWLLLDVQATLKVCRQPENLLKTLCDVLDDSGEPALQDIASGMRSSIAGKNLKHSIFSSHAHILKCRI